jgi:Holliday junction resolvasome RuvABC endonuclease subunit
VIWGIDLGVRSVHLAGFDGDDLVYLESIETPKRVVRSLELDTLGKRAKEFIDSEDDVFVEKPPFAGPKNVATFGELHQVYGTMLSHVGGREAIVTAWKKDVVGHGMATKSDVSLWLQDHHEPYSRQCGGDQNLVDAVCIALYGRHVVSRADTLGA